MFMDHKFGQGYLDSFRFCCWNRWDPDSGLVGLVSDLMHVLVHVVMFDLCVHLLTFDASQGNQY